MKGFALGLSLSLSIAIVTACDSGDEPRAHLRSTSSEPREVLRFGGPTARYELSIPDRFVIARGTRGPAQPGFDPAEMGPAAILLDEPPEALGANSITVGTDPEGLGIDMTRATPEQRSARRLVYDDLIQRRLPGSSTARLVEVGERSAWVYDIPVVVMPDRPMRAGRHYLVFDGVVTISVDCFWTPENEGLMREACRTATASISPAG